AVSILAVCPRGPEAVRALGVRRGMAELDGGGDAELREARDVLVGEQLRVLDAGTEAAPVLACPLECVEGVAVGEVADRVDSDGQLCPCARADDVDELIPARDLDAGTVEEARGLRAECAVHERLE